MKEDIFRQLLRRSLRESLQTGHDVDFGLICKGLESFQQSVWRWTKQGVGRVVDSLDFPVVVY